MVICQQFVRRQDLLIVLGELTLVEIAGLGNQVLNREAACFLVGDIPLLIANNNLLAVVPPLANRFAMLQTHRLRLGEVLISLRHIHTIEPGLFGLITLRSTLCCFVAEEDHIGSNRGIRRKDRARQTDDSMQVEVLQEGRLDSQFGTIGTEEEAIGDDDTGATGSLEPTHDKHHKEVGRFGRAHVGREILLGSGIGTATIGRVHGNHIHLVLLLERRDRRTQRVAMGDIGFVHIMHQQIGDREQVR